MASVGKITSVICIVHCTVFLLIGLQVTSIFLYCPMDGLMNNMDISQEVEVRSKRRRKKEKKSSCSKVFLCLLFNLFNNLHSHMLYFSDKKNKEFKVRLINKKSRKWTEKDISLFKELDSVFENRKRPKQKAEERSKGRYRANMKKLENKYIKKICTDKPDRSEKIETYRIISTEYLVKKTPTGMYDILNKKSLNLKKNETMSMDSDESFDLKVENENPNGLINQDSRSPSTDIVNGNSCSSTTLESLICFNPIISENSEPLYHLEQRCVDVRNADLNEQGESFEGNVYGDLTNLSESLENFVIKDLYSPSASLGGILVNRYEESKNLSIAQNEHADYENTNINMNENGCLNIELENLYCFKSVIPGNPESLNNFEQSFVDVGNAGLYEQGINGGNTYKDITNPSERLEDFVRNDLYDPNARLENIAVDGCEELKDLSGSIEQNGNVVDEKFIEYILENVNSNQMEHDVPSSPDIPATNGWFDIFSNLGEDVELK